MININCYDDISNDQITLVRMIAFFIMTDLKLSHDITININTLEEMDDSTGYCYSDKELDICFENDIIELVRVIAHELRHIYQRYHNFFDFDKRLYKKYEDLPWEIDASRYEENIIKRIIC